MEGAPASEHNARGRRLRAQPPPLPRDVSWHLDPSGPNERTEMRVAGSSVIPGNNASRPGLAKIAARQSDTSP